MPLGVRLFDADGIVLTNRTVAWTTSADEMAAVTSSGLLRNGNQPPPALMPHPECGTSLAFSFSCRRGSHNFGVTNQLVNPQQN